MSREKFNFRFDDASNVFFTSDTHFNHGNIIRFCNRPFSSVEEMNEEMIRRWNETVPEDGLVFHLGDFAWGDKWKPILERLNGRKVLILGNHDYKNFPGTKQMEEFFEDVQQQMYIRLEGRAVYLNHFPLLCYSGVHRRKEDVVYALNGHIHLGPLSLDGKDVERMRLSYPSQYDVGVDMNDFKPVSWKVVNEKIAYQMENEVNMMTWVEQNK